MGEGISLVGRKVAKNSDFLGVSGQKIPKIWANWGHIWQSAYAVPHWTPIGLILRGETEKKSYFSANNNCM